MLISVHSDLVPGRDDVACDARRTTHLSPSMKKVARQPSSSSTARNSGVDCGSGPSSNVNATCPDRPIPTRLGVRRTPIGDTPASGRSVHASAPRLAAPPPVQRASCHSTSAEPPKGCASRRACVSRREVGYRDLHRDRVTVAPVEQVYLPPFELVGQALGTEGVIWHDEALLGAAREELVERRRRRPETNSRRAPRLVRDHLSSLVEVVPSLVPGKQGALSQPPFAMSMP